MNRLRLPCLLLTLLLSTTALAAARVLELHYAAPSEVAGAIRSVHGDAVRVDIVRQRLVVVGTESQVEEIAALVRELDQAPLPLALTLATQAPAPTGEGRHYQAGGDTFEHSGSDTIEVSAIEGALITIDHSRFAQQAVSAGWTIELAEAPITVEAVTLQIHRRADQLFDIVVGYTDYSSGERRVYGTTLAAREGEWTSLLPSAVTAAPADGTHYSTARQSSDQLWLRVDAAH